MKLYDILISMILMLCFVGAAYAATNAVPIIGSNGGHHGKAIGKQASVTIPANTATSAKGAAISNAVSFTSTPVSGNCVDNSKMIAVYGSND
jgi:hypothetical protein